MAFVIDSSVTSGWFLENQSNEYTEAVGARLQEERAHAPAIWELELVNILRTSCMRRRMTAEAAQAVLADFAMLAIDIDRTPVRPGELLALALRFDLSSYDAAYLELALRLQLPIASRDAPLREAALASGVGVVPG